MDERFESAYRMFLSGVGIKKCANTFRVNRTTLRNFFISKGISPEEIISRKQSIKNHQKVIDYYNVPNTVNQTAKHFGVSRNVIYRILNINGIENRSASEANILAAKKLTPEERKKRAYAANEAVRNADKSFHIENSVKQAKTKQKTKSKMGFGEKQVFEQFKNIGYTPVLQKAFHVYNVDVMVGSVPVEIHNLAVHPHTHDATLKRIKYFLKSGVSIVYFKIHGSSTFNEFGLNKLVALVNFLNRNPPSQSQYWMIRGTGEIEFTGIVNDADEFTLIEVPENLF